MSDEKLLQALAELAREQSGAPAADPRFASLAAGELEPAEVAELAELAASDEEARVVFEGAQPLRPEVREQWEEQIVSLRAGASQDEPPPSGRVRSVRPRHNSDGLQDDAHAGESDAAPRVEPLPAFESEPPPISTKQPRRHRGQARRMMGRWGMAIVPLLAAAAALLLWLWPASHPPLPHYQLGEVKVGSAQMRSTTAPSGLRVRLGRGEKLRVVLQPSEAAEQPVELRAYRIHQGTAALWPVPIEQADSGAFRITARVDEHMAVTPGAYTLAFVIAHPGQLPDAEAVMRALAAGSSDTPWRLLSVPIVVEEAQP